MTKQEIQNLKKEVRWLKIFMAIQLSLVLVFVWIMQDSIIELYEHNIFAINKTDEGFSIIGDSIQQITDHLNNIYSILVYGNQTIEGILGNTTIEIVVDECDYDYGLPIKNNLGKELL